MNLKLKKLLRIKFCFLEMFLLLFYSPLLIAKNDNQVKVDFEKHTENTLTDAYIQKKLILNRIGNGRNNVVQGVVYNNETSFLYTLHVTGKPEKGVVNRFKNINNKQNLTAIDFQKPSEFIGHQGISEDPKTRYLLTSAGAGVENSGWYITFFKFSNDSLPEDVSFTKVFDNNYDSRSSTMPVISSEANHLIVRSKLNGINVIRVYNYKKLDVQYMSDISTENHVEWPLDAGLTKNNFVLQAITADEKYVYLLSGGRNDSSKRLYIYTLKGKLVRKFDNVILGKNDASVSGKEKHWEPEGLAIDKANNALVIMYALGDHKKRFAQLYFVPISRLLSN